MHTNAIENWLVRMDHRAVALQQQLDWTYHVQLSEPGSLELRFPELAKRVIRSPVPLGKRGFFRAFFRICRAGKFSVVHVHGDLLSAPYALVAKLAGASKVIVHVHNPDESVMTPSRWKQALLKPILRRTCLALADRVAANSKHSLATFLAGRAPRPGKDSVHYLGIDPAPFAALTGDRATLRRELGIADDAPIMLFAGRMTPEKNPVFAVDVLAALRRRMPQVHGVFAGAGSLEGAVGARIQELGQADATHFLGWRDDVPVLMVSSDWFILPHPEDPPEGFGVAVVEAQLAGLRLLMSHGVRDDPLLPTACERRLSLSDDPELWADAAIDLWHGPKPSREAALAALRASPMDMDFALADLQALHQ